MYFPKSGPPKASFTQVSMTAGDICLLQVELFCLSLYATGIDGQNELIDIRSSFMIYLRAFPPPPCDVFAEPHGAL